MRTELLEEHRRNIHTEEPAVVSVSSLTLEEEPALDGCTDIREIRILLCDWVSWYQDGPEAQDVDRIMDLLTDLIHAGDIEKARLIIIYLDYLTKDAAGVWKQQVHIMKETVQKLTYSKYGYPLAFY